jgi:hypothetical protein
MTDDHSDLLRIANASGFPFQLKMEQEIRKTEPERQHRWQFVAREFRWELPARAHEGFIDLVLESGIARMAIEFKRVTDGSWIFLIPDSAPEVTSATLFWTRRGPQTDAISAYHSFTVAPRSFQAGFCVVRGHGEKEPPFMERLCTLLQESTQALAFQELSIPETSELDKARVFIPAIVTNARLYACEFASADVDLVSGKLPSARFTPLPFIRFHKSLSLDIPRTVPPRNLREKALADESTVFVVTAEHTTTLLKELDLPYTGSWPWT